MVTYLLVGNSQISNILPYHYTYSQPVQMCVQLVPLVWLELPDFLRRFVYQNHWTAGSDWLLPRRCENFLRHQIPLDFYLSINREICHFQNLIDQIVNKPVVLLISSTTLANRTTDIVYLLMSTSSVFLLLAADLGSLSDTSSTPSVTTSSTSVPTLMIMMAI